MTATLGPTTNSLAPNAKRGTNHAYRVILVIIIYAIRDIYALDSSAIRDILDLLVLLFVILRGRYV